MCGQRSRIRLKDALSSALFTKAATDLREVFSQISKTFGLTLAAKYVPLTMCEI